MWGSRTPRKARWPLPFRSAEARNPGPQTPRLLSRGVTAWIAPRAPDLGVPCSSNSSRRPERGSSPAPDAPGEVIRAGGPGRGGRGRQSRETRALGGGPQAAGEPPQAHALQCMRRRRLPTSPAPPARPLTEPRASAAPPRRRCAPLAAPCLPSAGAPGPPAPTR